MEPLWESSVMEIGYRDKDDVSDKNESIEIFERDYGVDEHKKMEDSLIDN